MAVINTIQIKNAAELYGYEKYDLYLKTLLTIVEGTIPGNRSFGMDESCLSEPPDMAMNLFVADLQEKIKMFIPELEFSDVTWTAQSDGSLTPSLYLKVREEDGQND